MRKHINEIQSIKFKVLREVAVLSFAGRLEEEKDSIAELVDPGPEPRIRCCIHKERAITTERVNLAIGGDRSNPNVVEVLPAACDGCPIDRFVVTDACRGCLSHQCLEVCPIKGAIFFSDGSVYINQKKCVECGKCKEVCPYHAIIDRMRPCKRVCPTDSLQVDENRKATIEYETCVQCGLCIAGCPFGAIMDKSSIANVIELLIKAKTEDAVHLYAVVAPAIASQINGVQIGQITAAIKKLGFYDVLEVALGAEVVAYHEAHEFAEDVEEKRVITSSCCPAFVSLIKMKYPTLADNISSTVSPMIAISRLIKQMDKKAKIVFIGPCVAKKNEITQGNLGKSTDFVLTFEEIDAILDAKGIQIEECEAEEFGNASYFGRVFARTGGLVEAVRHVIDVEEIDVDFKPISCDGADECKKALRLAKDNRLTENFIEGMVCKGGCIAGACTLSRGPRDKKKVEAFGKLAITKVIKDSLEIFNTHDVNMHR